jgi:hypothetical protein
MAQAKILIVLRGLPEPETLKSQVETPVLVFNDREEVHQVSGRGRKGRNVGRVEESLPDQKLRADQQGVAGKGGASVVGGVPGDRMSRSQGKDLPKALSGAVEKISEPIGLGAEIPNSAVRGQG